MNRVSAFEQIFSDSFLNEETYLNIIKDVDFESELSQNEITIMSLDVFHCFNEFERDPQLYIDSIDPIDEYKRNILKFFLQIKTKILPKAWNEDLQNLRDLQSSKWNHQAWKEFATKLKNSPDPKKRKQGILILRSLT